MTIEAARCALHAQFVSAAIPLLTFLEKSFGELEKNELIERISDYVEVRFPYALQLHADVFINYAVTALHGDGPQMALANLAKDLLGLPSEQDVEIVQNIFARLNYDANQTK